jgi:hypothetical protein
MTTLHRTPKAGKREIRRALAAGNVAEAVGPITPGCEIFGLMKGQFSLVDLIVFCLQTTGPADVIISTWTAAGADLGHPHKLLTEGHIRSLRFLLDFSFGPRQPAYLAALVEKFGTEAARISKSHAKFVTVRNREWDLVIRSSANLNENRRLETFEVSDDKQMADYLTEVVDTLFAIETGAQALAKKPGQHMKDFEQFAEPNRTEDHAAAARSTDSRKYFDPSPFGNDLNRAGLTYSKGA